MLSPFRLLLLIGASAGLSFACGGAVDSDSRRDQLGPDGGPGETGGASSGSGGGSSEPSPGTGGSPGAGGVGQGGGTSPGGYGGQTSPGSGGQWGCCLAAASCNPGDTPIAGPSECPPGVMCYSNHVCCSTQWCVPAPINCDAIPVCDPGDREIGGECPPAYSCYERSLCGTTIHCLETLPDGGPAPIGPDSDGGASCNPSTEYNRHYVATSPGQCALIDFACPAETSYFDNACGCGCEQPADCPEWVDCMPGDGDRSALCSDSTRCPYTIRAL